MFVKLLIIVVPVILGLLWVDYSESTAEAGLLKNGVRPGDRSRMHIIRRPKSGQRKRIFAPGERKSITKPKSKSKGGGKKRRGQQYAWFWKTYNPGLTAARAGRWTEALSTMSERRNTGRGIVGSATVREIGSTYGRQITQAAARHGVSEALLIAVITVESRGKLQARSPKGAQGLMQLMPATAKRFGVGNAYEPSQNIGGGAAYLSWLLKEFRGDVLLALAGYNAGEGAVRKHRGVPPYTETRDYVVKVMDALVVAKGLCSGPLGGPRVRCDLKVASN